MDVASPLLEGLNPQQREAVLAAEGPVLILAGAGSGKTRVITHRLAWLVRERGVPSEAILAVTFTNKAAGEMKARAEALVPGGGLRSWISTFHSLCVRLLRRHPEAAGLSPDFVIYDEDDQLAVVRQVLRELDLPEKVHPPRRLLSRISARKNRPRQEREEADDSLAASLTARVEARYAELLRAAHALDFDDLLLCAVRLLQGDEAVRESYRRRFRYVLVDEYQDTNRAQYELVRALVPPAGNLTVVGDEDQSIYSWRGADIQNILDFEHDFPGARVLRLEENYRSSQAILDAAGALVAHNRHRKGKTLRATRRGGERVRLHQAGDEFEEAAFVVERIAAHRHAGSVAVLFRMNAQSRLLEEGLRRVGIPYAVVGGVGFYERREVKDLLAYLRLVRNPREPVALRRVLNVPPRGIGAKTVDEIERLAAERHLSPFEALGAVEQEQRLPARATAPLARFRQMLELLQGDALRLGVKDLLSRILEVSGYSAWLAEEDSQESQERLANLAELLSAAAEYEAREESPSVSGFLDGVSLLADLDLADETARVVLMTLHAAKGLEFETVFLVGLEEGLVPHARSQERPEAIEEERRLVYVGMTRAKSRLFLTTAASRAVFGQRRASEPSRFLEELPRPQLELTGSVGAYARREPRPAWGGRAPSRFAPPRALPGAAPAASRVAPPPSSPAAGSTDLAGVRPGTKVRHPLFGVGTVLRSDGAGDELKLTVSFLGIGAKRLVARYAGLTVE